MHRVRDEGRPALASRVGVFVVAPKQFVQRTVRREAMNKILVAIFDSEAKAYAGSKILRDLDAEGSIETYAMAVLVKDASGKVAVKQSGDDAGVGTAVGLLTGSLVGLFAGPVGLTLTVSAGTLGGALYDLAKVGIGGDFIEEVGNELKAGKSAVIAEVWEEWITPVDTRMEAAGGTVYRRAREDVVDAQLERDASVLKAEAASLKAEYARAVKENKAKLEAKVEGIRVKLRATQERARAALTGVKQEFEAKINKLQAKASKAHAETKAELERRIADARAELGRRSDKLQQAWQLTKEALAG